RDTQIAEKRECSPSASCLGGCLFPNTRPRRSLLAWLPCMRVPAGLIAVPLVAGCTAGLILGDPPDRSFEYSAAAAAILAWLAALAWVVDGCAYEAATTIVMGAFCEGLSIGASGARQAYAPPLLVWFDSCDATAREDPIVLEGALREDAALTPYGAAITLDVSRVVSDACPSVG